MNTSDRLNTIDQTTKQFQETFGHLTEQQLTFKPAEDTWSIAQNVDHLIQLNQSYFPVIEAVKNGDYRLPAFGKLKFFTHFFGKILFDSVQPDNKRKSKTFTPWLPKENSASILKAFAEHQNELKKVIMDSDDLLKKGVVISSPANKYIVYKLEKAFDIIVTHEQRHLVQAKKVLEQLPEA